MENENKNEIKKLYPVESSKENHGVIAKYSTGAESVAEKEERILKFWRDNKIFEKSVSRKSKNGEFNLYDGPPFATGQPHYGHIIAGTIKDAVPRYKTMRGYKVPRRWGWDCHGLPIENLIESELNLKTKKDIEIYGIDKFNKAAEASVLRYAKDWKTIVPRTGRFIDMENDYRTMDSSYTESVWWVFKNIYDKGLISEGYKPMHICPRCETTLANFEVSQGYKDITDLSVIGKFELVDEPGTFILAWTTTPWTLPGNVALAVGEDIDYVKIEFEGAKYILAKNRLSVIKGEFKIISEFKGSELVGKSYKPIFDYYSKKEDLENKENGWKIYSAPFVTTEDGTGVVHIAPAFGEDDMRLGKDKNLPFVQHVGMDGRFKSEVTDFVGIQVKPKDDPKASLGQDPKNLLGQGHQSTDVLIIKNLAGRGLLFGKEKIIHSYPHCWRCDTPLLNYAASSWFLKVTEIKSKIIANNKKINWVPENLKEGRFGKWLEGSRDWAISRSRYWGAPLPVWKCEKCEEIKVVGSIEDIKKGTNSGNKYFVMRHGESDSVEKDVISSVKTQKDNHLTEKGKKQVLASTKNLKKNKFDFIFSSDFTRTKETAEIVTEAIGFPKEKIIFDERLRELQVGDLDGKSVKEYDNYFVNLEERFTKNSPNGENHQDTKRRMMDVLFEIDSKYKGKNILIISHGDPIWMLLAGVQGLKPKDAVIMRGGDLKPGEVQKFDFSPFPHNENYELDLHRPYIDNVKFSCDCGGEFKRIPEVFDCWYESGSMPYGQAHYPFENKKAFEKSFPADFIAEGLDQTRGWFYSLMVLSTALFNKPAFKNVVVNGLLLAEDGQKMSKRLKNYPDVNFIMDKYGADAMRYYLLSSPAVRAEEVNFSEKGVDEVYKKIILRLYNVLSFYELYEDSKLKSIKSKNVLDKWIIARLTEVLKETTESMEKYELDRAVRPIADFVDDLSTWYLRRSRDRFKSDDKKDKESALFTVKTVISELSKIMAPFMPFIADELYQKMRSKKDPESVHLSSWSKIDKKKIDKKLLQNMAEVRKIVSLGLEARVKSGMRVRQPLNELKVKNPQLKGKKDFIELIKDELNVKNISFDKNLAEEVFLDIVLTSELKEEGIIRELVRNVQEMRKKNGLTPGQKIILMMGCAEKEKTLIEKYEDTLKKSINAKEVSFGVLDSSEKFEIDGNIFSVGIIL